MAHGHLVHNLKSNSILGSKSEKVEEAGLKLKQVMNAFMENINEMINSAK
jgi:hypothetical protein